MDGKLTAAATSCGVAASPLALEEITQSLNRPHGCAWYDRLGETANCLWSSKFGGLP